MATEMNTMPHNRDAEMALLGCLLMDNDIAIELVEKISEDTPCTACSFGDPAFDRYGCAGGGRG